jgi:hypothetical protein
VKGCWHCGGRRRGRKINRHRSVGAKAARAQHKQQITIRCHAAISRNLCLVSAIGPEERRPFSLRERDDRFCRQVFTKLTCEGFRVADGAYFRRAVRLPRRHSGCTRQRGHEAEAILGLTDPHASVPGINLHPILPSKRREGGQPSRPTTRISAQEEAVAMGQRLDSIRFEGGPGILPRSRLPKKLVQAPPNHGRARRRCSITEAEAGAIHPDLTAASRSNTPGSPCWAGP